MSKIIDGKLIAEKVKDEIAQAIYKLNGPRPNLAIILVGGREDSELYVSLKEKEGKKIGIDTHLYKLDSSVPEKELLEVIDFLNSDPLVDGILVQLPLPKEFDTDRIIAAIDPKKDVDGFHPDHPDYVLSPVLAAVRACLKDIRFDPIGKSACVLYNSEVFGQSVKDLLEPLGLQVSLKQHPEKADLLVTALGEPEKIKAAMVKDDAVVIDIGIAKVDGKVLGDVDFEDVKSKVSFITPVPGGIGPMTIAFLFKNVWEIYRRRHNLI
ncbi:MAG: bifunctional 5,10-methylenetetrahydrofolate dehydrogenase/5,10-methenyltetrahydrofolate cyclohydrolase [Patescibacteria group bacterium]|jgi:methylenetetrahydrofolate dehydrogenase (NADP+)/methenyltetrahydrofolate cyclohydrolase